MNEQQAMLDEFIAIKPQKGRLFDALTVSFFLYMAFVLVTLAADTERLSPKRQDWQLGIVILPLPLLGTVLHLTSKKIGWVINAFYYLLIALIMLYGLAWNVLEDKNFHIQGAWQGLLLLTSAGMSSILLFSRPIRKYFNVSGSLLLTVAAISFGIATTMAFTILRN